MGLRGRAVHFLRCLRIRKGCRKSAAGPEQDLGGTEGAPRVCSVTDSSPGSKGLHRDLGEMGSGE